MDRKGTAPKTSELENWSSCFLSTSFWIVFLKIVSRKGRGPPPSWSSSAPAFWDSNNVSEEHTLIIYSAWPDISIVSTVKPPPCPKIWLLKIYHRELQQGGQIPGLPPLIDFKSFSLSFRDFYLKMKYVIDHWHPDILNLGFAWFWWKYRWFWCNFGA